MIKISPNHWRYHDGFWETLTEYYYQGYINCPKCKENLHHDKRNNKNLKIIFNNECFNVKEDYWQTVCPECNTKIRVITNESMVGTL